MRSLFILSFLAFANADQSTFVPRFTLVTDRKESLSGLPEVAIRFPNGITDSLDLSRFFPNDEERMANSNPEACRYIGHLADEVTACVAMTGCPGEEDVELTILSRHNLVSSLYRWNKDGSVDIIDSKLNREDDDEEIDSNTDQVVNTIEKSCQEGKTCEKPPPTGLLQIRFGYDDDFLALYQNIPQWAEEYIENVMPHMQAIYCHESLGYKIVTQRIGKIKHYAGENWKVDEETMSKLDQMTIDELKGADLMVFMTFDGTNPHHLGKAHLRSICSEDSKKKSINAWVYSYAYAAQNIGHEIAHNLGIRHDRIPAHEAAGCYGDGVPNYMMNNGLTSNVWSPCSKADFEAWYYTVVHLLDGKWCLDVAPKACVAGVDPASFTTTSTTTTTTTETTTTSTTTTTTDYNLCDDYFIGDGFCDVEYNIEECDYDGGDCDP